MFRTLGQNSSFYILDKSSKPKVIVGKITKVDINPQCYGMTVQEMDIYVDCSGEKYEFKKIPADVSIISPSPNIIISDNTEDMSKEFESIANISQTVLDSVDYHKGIIESKDDILSILNPKYAKEKEQANKLNLLEDKVGNMEKGIDDIKAILSKMINNKQGGI